MTISASSQKQNNRYIRPVLRQIVLDALTEYYNSLQGEEPSSVYNLTLIEAELALLQVTLDFAYGNQANAARILGINRETLVKKLKFYELM